MTLGQRVVRVITNLVVRWPRLWPLLRPLVRRMFDRIAPHWEGVRSEDSFAPFEAGLDRVSGPIRRVLDSGTGTGAGARVLRRRYPDARVVGTDVSAAMLEEARKHAPEIEYVEADAARLPFEDASFDLVTHANMIPFVDEAARVLRPGGWTLYAFSAGPDTPIWVEPERLRTELARRGFADFAQIAAGRGIAVVARKPEPD